MANYYDGAKLLSLSDINGNRPEIYMVTSNRSGGKTTYFGRMCINRFIKHGEKFGLLYRFNYELDDCADKFFKDIGGLFFQGYTMTSIKKGAGVYHELFLNGKSCGYAMAINSADQIKKNSHLFSDIQRFIFDEFQSETNHYCSNEVKKFISIHTSIARGQGQQVRYLPVYMISNPVTILNPYFVAMNISSKISPETKFLRGDGFVLEQAYIESASLSQKSSGFNKAFAGNSYIQYSSDNQYLNDNNAFIEKPTGNSTYLATIKFRDRLFAIREYRDLGYIFCDDTADKTFRYKISVTTDDHQINFVMLKRNDTFISTLRFYFERGCVRFKDLACKEALLTLLSY